MVIFRIRRVYDASLPINRHVIGQVEDIIRSQFDDISDQDIRRIPDKLHNPMKYDFRSVLFVSDTRNGVVRGFSLFSADPDLGFGYLDLLALTGGTKGGGVGAALYRRVREECINLGLDWLLFESRSDDPALNADPAELKENRARMRFYERLGAHPVLGTDWDQPRKANQGHCYSLMVDALGREDAELGLQEAQSFARAILKTKYRGKVTPRQIEKIVASFRDDPVRIRAGRTPAVKSQPILVTGKVPEDRKVIFCVADKHEMHHIKDHGYAEQPVRVASILEELDKSELFRRVPRRHFKDQHILAVHDRRFVNFFREVALSIPPEQSLYPDVFPIRKSVGTPKNIRSHAGYYCIDIYSPINRNAYLAARDAVDAALTAAGTIERGARIAYALVRPPGHHAGYDSFGGYCYFNSNAIAAHFLTALGRVAILDLDYHHGNGQQEIFYRRNDVLTISIHADPAFEYPYFSGSASERGEDAGAGFNLNIPLPRAVDGARYLPALQRACQRIRAFKPVCLVVALGLDTARNDPSGTWDLVAEDFHANGLCIGALNLPVLVVQEGGYDCSVLGQNAAAFLTGLWEDDPRSHGKSRKTPMKKKSAR